MIENKIFHNFIFNIYDFLDEKAATITINAIICSTHALGGVICGNDAGIWQDNSWFSTILGGFGISLNLHELKAKKLVAQCTVAKNCAS